MAGYTEVPTVYVEGNQRRDVEHFARKLEDLGTPVDCPAPEHLSYARMDASALLSRISKGKAELFDALQDAIMNHDIKAFVDALLSKGSLSIQDSKRLQEIADSKDAIGFANMLRYLGTPRLEELRAEAEASKVSAKEIANPVDPLMGTERRCKASVYLSSFALPGESAVPRHEQQRDHLGYTAMQLGDDHDKWEETLVYHYYLQDCANAACDLMQEARGVGYLDGRCAGDRGQVPSVWI